VLLIDRSSCTRSVWWLSGTAFPRRIQDSISFYVSLREFYRLIAAAEILVFSRIYWLSHFLLTKSIQLVFWHARSEPASIELQSLHRVQGIFQRLIFSSLFGLKIFEPSRRLHRFDCFWVKTRPKSELFQVDVECR